MRTCVKRQESVIQKMKTPHRWLPWRWLSSHFDCLVRMWLAHHHEYALLAARCSILSLPPPSPCLKSNLAALIFSLHDNYHAREERLETKGARKEEGGEVIVRLIAKSFPCRYTTMAKNSKHGERLKERRTQHSKGTRKVIQQDFPSCTCLSKRHCPVDESTMKCSKSHNRLHARALPKNTEHTNELIFSHLFSEAI